MALMNLAMDDAYNRRRWGQGLFDQQRGGANPYFGGGASVRANSSYLAGDNTRDIYQHGLPFGVGGYNPNNPRYASLNKNPNYDPNTPDSTQAYLQNKYFDQPMRDVELQNAQLGLNANLLTAPSVAGEQRSAFERGQAISYMLGVGQGTDAAPRSAGTYTAGGQTFNLPKRVPPGGQLTPQDIMSMTPENQNLLAQYGLYGERYSKPAEIAAQSREQAARITAGSRTDVANIKAASDQAKTKLTQEQKSQPKIMAPDKLQDAYDNLEIDLKDRSASLKALKKSIGLYHPVNQKQIIDMFNQDFADNPITPAEMADLLGQGAPAGTQSQTKGKKGNFNYQ